MYGPNYFIHYFPYDSSSSYPVGRFGFFLKIQKNCIKGIELYGWCTFSMGILNLFWFPHFWLLQDKIKSEVARSTICLCLEFLLFPSNTACGWNQDTRSYSFCLWPKLNYPFSHVCILSLYRIVFLLILVHSTRIFVFIFNEHPQKHSSKLILRETINSRNNLQILCQYCRGK